MKRSTLFFGLSLCWYVSFSQDTTKLSLLFFGDVMQHDSQIAAAYDLSSKKHDYHSSFQYIKKYFSSADLVIGNLELTLAGPPFTGYPQFSAPDELLVALKDAGADVLVTANNHCVDKGRKGLERTIKMLDSMQVLHTGTFVDSTSREKNYPLVIEKNGFKLVLLNYTFSTNGLPVRKPNVVNRIDTAIIRKDLIKARTLDADAIIVFMHWGAEYQQLPNQGQKNLAEFCLAHGAQMVIGAHPHAIQPMHWYKEKNQLVAYSLGNFISGQRKRYTDGGALLRVELKKISNSINQPTVTIDSVGYLLEWVHKTAGQRKEFVILPIPEFENDTTGFFDDHISKAAMKLYVDDARRLFGTQNREIYEIRDLVEEGTFAIDFECSAEVLNQTNLLSPFGSVEQVNEKVIRLRSFETLNFANYILDKIKKETVFKNGKIIKEEN